MSKKEIPNKPLEKNTPKSVNLSPIRVDLTLKEEIQNRANNLYPSAQNKNVSKYIRNLIIADIDQSNDIPADQDCIDVETKHLHQQVRRIGNNLNQIAHALNKMKSDKPLNFTETQNINRFYKELQEIQLNIAKLT
ncbi:MAG: plasmid mobilization relaxosome protein MobC [Verrucomicrobiota bacterium]|nr:plasmid mobilization relaxosome protein MobC [Verrucomicrobiota bacterium]